MNKIYLNERDLLKIVKKVINEQQLYAAHPIESKLYKEMEVDLEGDGPYLLKQTGNQIVAQGIKNTWTITKGQHKGSY